MNMRKNIIFSIVFLFCGSAQADSDSAPSIDLRSLAPEAGLTRILGYSSLQSGVFGAGSLGLFGLPVTGGLDINGDGFKDYAFADMDSSSFVIDKSGIGLKELEGGGQINIIFGDGTIGKEEELTSEELVSITIGGAAPFETAGSEIWMSDVTGDGLGDLIIARQNFSLPNRSRTGTGAVTIIPGSPALYDFALTQVGLRPVDKAGVFNLSGRLPDGIKAFTIIGEEAFDRLGIWVRTGDITGDGIDDIAIGADQAASPDKGDSSGKAYVIRGGSHLQNSARIDLAKQDRKELQPHLMTILPPDDSTYFNFGGTLNIADLDDNDQAEVIVAATLYRSSARRGPTRKSFRNASASGWGGSNYGRVFIIWDELFQGDWSTNNVIDLEERSQAVTDIQGSYTELYVNQFFGEEILGGLDYNQDGHSDLFIGDISGDTSEYSGSGLGFVFFSAGQLKGLKTDVASLSETTQMSVILGHESGTISGDTAMHGDFDNDGIADLAISSPNASPEGRTKAGVLHVLWGQEFWPEVIDLQPNSQTFANGFKMTNILGANGTASVPTGSGDSFMDWGDTIAYGGTAGDIDDDGYIDIITNEMGGNAPETPARLPSYDIGNLIIISGKTLAENK